MRLLVGLSGGVDSSYVVSWARDRGHDVTACLLVMQEGDVPVPKPDAVSRARATCDALGVPLVVRDVTADFHGAVVEPFLDAYARGETPNPCSLCNRDLKLQALLALAEERGFDRVATGHYARIVTGEDGVARIARGEDRAKDQSYFLARLTSDQVSRLLFPLADTTKEAVRRLAEAADLPAAAARDSEGVCFAPDGDYRELLRLYRPEALRAGPIVDEAGHELGRHGGTALYTLGQRKGLGLSGGPWFIHDLDPATAAITVGHAQPRASRLTLTDWSTNVPLERLLANGTDVQTHYRTRALPATFSLDGDGHLEVAFTGERPLAAPGQSAVLYRDDVVVGEGTIASLHQLDRQLIPVPPGYSPTASAVNQSRPSA